MNEMFYFFLLFYYDLDLNNEKILCLPSIFQFERTVHNLSHPNEHDSRLRLRNSLTQEKVFAQPWKLKDLFIHNRSFINQKVEVRIEL